MTAATSNSNATALTSPSRLRKIDVLREKNVGQYLPLPQLVAVGDQSSGKSSLLESITGIPFPHGQELCTRYATQITHRRDEYQRIDITIIPGPHASSEHAQRLKSYSRQVRSDKDLMKEFRAILNEVNAAMGIRTKANPTGSHTFSEDVLRIEKCGPDEDYLTVIDVPGIFRATAEGITVDDRDLVKKMVKRYIKDDRTIILAVLPSNVDVATQEILELAKEYDKTGERTLGVLTKPDSLSERSQKASVCNLVLGKRMPLALGYYVVRNRGADDDDTAQVSLAAERERMFTDDPWSTLPRERVGVAALRDRLQELLGQITDRAFPKLLSETRTLFKAAEKEFLALGPARHTEREQQAYLTRIAGKFQEFVRDALAANYSYHDAFEHHGMRLITTVINLTADFSREFDEASHSHCFKTAQSGKPDDWTVSSAGRAATPATTATTTQSDGEGDECCDTVVADDLISYPELQDLIAADVKSEPPADDDIMEWIGPMRLGSRAVELGTFGPAMLASAFREQSRKWRAMTEQYVGKVILAVHRFFHGALASACHDARTRERLSSAITDELLERYGEGLRQARMLVDIEREKRPYTLSEMFNRNLQTSRGRRMAAALAPKARWESTKNGSLDPAKLVVDYDVIETAITSRSNDAFEKEDIHDILEAYYNVARKRFVDNLWHQAVDHVLLSGPASPLGLFSEQWVIGLDNEKLEMVAGEPRGVAEKREALRKRMRDLKEAMHVLR